MSDSYENWLFAGHACEIPEPGDFVATPDIDPAFEAIEGWAEPIPRSIATRRRNASRLKETQNGRP
jgi:hypothetical protein